MLARSARAVGLGSRRLRWALCCLREFPLVCSSEEILPSSKVGVLTRAAAPPIISSPRVRPPSPSLLAQYPDEAADKALAAAESLACHPSEGGTALAARALPKLAIAKARLLARRGRHAEALELLQQRLLGEPVLPQRAPVPVPVAEPGPELAPEPEQAHQREPGGGASGAGVDGVQAAAGEGPSLAAPAVPAVPAAPTTPAAPGSPGWARAAEAGMAAVAAAVEGPARRVLMLHARVLAARSAVEVLRQERARSTPVADAVSAAASAARRWMRSLIYFRVPDRLRVLLPADHSLVREAEALLEEWAQVVREYESSISTTAGGSTGAAATTEEA